MYCDTDSGWQYLVRHLPSARDGRSTRRGWSWRRVSYLPIWPGKHGAYWCLPWCPSGAAELESLSLFFGGVGNVPFLFYPISVHGSETELKRLPFIDMKVTSTNIRIRFGSCARGTQTIKALSRRRLMGIATVVFRVVKVQVKRRDG